ncbi:MAG TPA: hypothetical protein VGK19_17610 [Capsulimonadaceae bacterium]|jgi:hypothetical protein
MKAKSALMRAVVPAVALSLLFAAGSPPVAAQQAALKVSGVLAQSQPAGTKAATFLSADGVAYDSKGVLWVGEGQLLYGITFTAGKATIARTVSVPTGVNPAFHIQSDGPKVYYASWDGKVFTVDTTQADPKPVQFASLGKFRSAVLAPAGLTKGFAAKNKILALDNVTVTGYASDGTSNGTVLALPPPAAGAPYYNAIGMDPLTGDAIVAGYYADINVYRYGVDGKEIKEGGWPRGMFAMALPNVGNTPFGLSAGGGAKSLATPLDPATVATVDNEWVYYGNGLVQDPAGSYLYATSQGLVRFDKHGKPLHQRVGGIHNVKVVSLTSDGTVLAFVDRGGRVVRLALDDDPDASFTSNANEPWRVGGNWSGNAAAVVADGTTFLVLDGPGKQVWRFDPTQSIKGQSNWSKAGTPAGLTAPNGLAIADTMGWVIDGSRVLEGSRADLTTAKAVTLPGIADASGLAFIAAVDDATLVVAGPQSVTAFTRGGNGAYTQLWKSAAPFVKIAGLAATAAGVLVSDADAGTVTMLAPRTGAVVSKVDAAAVTGGFKPGAIAAQGGWAVVFDEQGYRLVRLKIAK